MKDICFETMPDRSTSAPYEFVCECKHYLSKDYRKGKVVVRSNPVWCKINFPYCDGYESSCRKFNGGTR